MTTEDTSTTAPVAEQGVAVAPAKDSAKKDARKKKSAPKGKKTAKAAAPAKKAKANKKAVAMAEPRAATPRAESKGAMILEMIGRPHGASLADLMKATEWQAHSIRGFLSTASKKRNLRIESSKDDTGVRIYRSK